VATHVVGTRHLTPDQVMGVIRHAHLVRFGITYPLLYGRYGAGHRYEFGDWGHVGCNVDPGGRKVNEPAPLALRHQALVYSPPMSEKRALVVSDAHLGGVPDTVDSALHAFLDEVPQPGDHLLINGDLFEFWFEYRSVIPRRAFPTLARLAAARQRGVRLTVIGGNHDRWGRRFWQDQLGAAFHPREVVLELAGWRSLVTHGDGVAEQHVGARVLHAITRNPVTASVFRWVHPDVGHGLVERLSGILGSSTRDPQVIAKAAAAQADWACEVLRSRGDLDLVVLGHTHRPSLVAVAERRWYLNPGAWMDGFRYAVITERGPELETYCPR